ncbi:MAG: gamma-glutamylcyclotransferase family protein [Granulosicoccus sp.]
MQRLFIYGTLAPGQVNHHVVADIPGDWQRASVRGTVIQLHCGPTEVYPGLIPGSDDELAGTVEGWVFSSEHLHSHWQRLDEFEGDEYERIVICVRIAESEFLEACVYAVNQQFDYQ